MSQRLNDSTSSLRRMSWSAFWTIAFVLAFAPSTMVGQPTAFVVEISGEVDLGLGPYVKRVISEARDVENSLLVLRVNTFGGRVDVATEIKDAVLEADMPTIAYVDKRAISAGALITLSTDKIAMAPGASMGAATPVHQTGEKASEKVVSYMRGEMRATAERTGRNPEIAAAMVDEDIRLDDTTLSSSGKLLTLTALEAQKVGYCDTIVDSIEEALVAFGYQGAELRSTDMNWAESLVRTLTSPFLSSLLIMIGLGGLFYAIKTGSIGTVAFVGIGALALFFGAQFLVDLASILEILLFVAGIALILIEVLVIPGFGVAGISGIVLMVAGLFLALVGSFDLVSIDSITVALYTLAGAFIGFALIVAGMIRFLPNSAAFRRFVLYGESVGSTEPFAEPNVVPLAVGALGTTLTTLRPSGTAVFEEDRFDVVSEGAFIPAGTDIRVVRIEGRRVVVRSVDAD